MGKVSNGPGGGAGEGFVSSGHVRHQGRLGMTAAQVDHADFASTRVRRRFVPQTVRYAGTRVEPLTRRVFDAIAAAVALVILLPLILAIAMAIRLTTAGPAFYVQKRVGLNGDLFPFIKFRTMVPGAELMRAEVLGLPDEDMPDRYRADPRITRVGRVLRRWSIDELPQLVNVLRGDMSLVGPRPIMPEELPLVEACYQARHQCRPGLTGLWQVSGRKETTWEERMALDVQYVQSQSLVTDARILTKTVSVVIKGDGAF